MRIGLIGAGRIGAFHASTLSALDPVEELIVCDVDPAAARRVASEVGGQVAADVAALLASQPDGVVITTGTATHADLLRASVAAGVATFCEKPVAATVAETIDLARLERETDIPIHIGFQRRFDTGYQRLRSAVLSGELGFIHTVRATTHDQSPPPARYIPTSGGILRDCSIHDFDAIRFVTGQEVASVFAVGANKGARFFTEAGDVDTAAAVLTLEDNTLAVVTATRYNGGGHDVRMEVHGSAGSMAAGLDDSFPFVSAQVGVTFPAGPQKRSFMERFQPAYVAELSAFVEVAARRRPSPCSVSDALAAFRVAEAATLSLHEGRAVRVAEIAQR